MKETEDYLKQIVKRYNLKDKTRERPVVFNRQYFCYYCKNIGLTQQRIGALLGRYNYKGDPDHTLAGHGYKACKNALETKDSLFINSVQEIAKELNLCPSPKNTKLNIPKSPFLTVINRIFEARDMADVEALKAYINENINPNKL